AAIPEQEEKTSIEEGCLTSRIIAAGKSLAEIISQVLNCRYVVVFALEPPDDHHLLLGISGLTPEQEERLRAETNRAPLVDYIHATDIARLRANHVVTIDLKHQPYPTPRSDFGARYRLIAPMVLHGQLVGLFVIAKTSTEHADIASAYTQEEIALAKGVAKLTALVIERVRLLQEWAEARARELALQEANRHYDSFLSIASHELRTPLTTVKGNMQLAQRRLETLKRQLEQSPTLIEQLERVQKPLEYAVQRANAQERMISELLDASRMQVGRLKIMIHPCNLIEIVQNVVKDVQQTAVDRELLLKLPEEKTIPIMADADRIGQVVHNYLTNALKYSPADRQVEVSVKQEGQLVYVFVKDEGPGLSPEAQTQIWERFYRAPGIEVQYGSDSGLGLGLYLSRTIIELHHGQVGVQSVQGKGSTFWFAIPVTRSSTLC
ncbi:MAG: HAMP domain-containing histidine kinase, partial [Ktedonobacteraceae bacterium]|nr:HAMP domain-containing histidine kinase [Ktedonobacteraceae bacterium]